VAPPPQRKPALHAAQVDDATAEANVPLAHGAHVAEPTVADEPAAQFAHAVAAIAPTAAEAVPAGHDVGVAPEGQYNPGGQRIAMVVAPAGHMKPAAHVWHAATDVEPGCALKEPAGHCCGAAPPPAQ